MGNSGSRFVWYELATTDVEAAKAFYARVVGWRAGDALIPGSAYSLFTAGDTPVAGLMELVAEARQNGAAPQWIGYAGVDDVDVAAGRVERLGGIVRIPPTDVRNVSRISVIADPEMAALALVKGSERGPGRPAQRNTPGHVCWYELRTSDVEKAFAFYSGLFGWDKADADVGPLSTYQQFSAGTETIGGIATKPGTWPWSLWLYYFSVPDIGAAAKRVEDAGGQVLFDPVALPGGARFVHCTDPQGAMFALMDRHLHIAVGCYSARDPSNRPGPPPMI
jgi:uncharacterized protein